MAKMYKTSNGKIVDIDGLRLKNEDSIAVGNMRTNARGDELGPGGAVVKSRNQVMDENYKLHSMVPTDDIVHETASAASRTVNRPKAITSQAEQQSYNRVADSVARPKQVSIARKLQPPKPAAPEKKQPANYAPMTKKGAQDLRYEALETTEHRNLAEVYALEVMPRPQTIASKLKPRPVRQVVREMLVTNENIDPEKFISDTASTLAVDEEVVEGIVREMFLQKEDANKLSIASKLQPPSKKKNIKSIANVPVEELIKEIAKDAETFLEIIKAERYDNSDKSISERLEPSKNPINREQQMVSIMAEIAEAAEEVSENSVLAKVKDSFVYDDDGFNAPDVSKSIASKLKPLHDEPKIKEQNGDQEYIDEHLFQKEVTPVETTIQRGGLAAALAKKTETSTTNQTTTTTSTTKVRRI